jgi:hypothetical protein
MSYCGTRMTELMLPAGDAGQGRWNGARSRSTDLWERAGGDPAPNLMGPGVNANRLSLRSVERLPHEDPLGTPRS